MQIPQYSTPDLSHPATMEGSSLADRNAIKRVLMTSDAAKCALVRVLLPDYVCFGYPIPEPCDDLLQENPSSIPKCPWPVVATKSTIPHLRGAKLIFSD